MGVDSSLQGLLAAIASFIVVTLIFAFILLICKKNRKPDTRTQNLTSTQSHAELTSIATYDSASFDPSLNQISMAELLKATKNFSPDLIVGDGSFGFVYKAKLSDDVTVAIKKLDKDAFQGFREFRAEMETLGKLRHKNIVKILGYCVSDFDRVLIYEFIEKGNLDQWLHDTSTGSDDVDNSRHSMSICRLPLSWETRVKVMTGVANGLAYLHELDKPIIHRDIKASNVLLDSNFEAHIADFGLARRIDTSHSHVSTQVAGTMGYMPPEYMGGNTAATVMLDVYSFGVLMIEVATQRRPNWPVNIDGREVGLVEWTRIMVEKNREIEMVDSNISREGLNEIKVKQYFRIACDCTNEKSRERPAMKEVVQQLELLAL